MRCVSYFARDVGAGTACFMMNDEWSIAETCIIKMDYQKSEHNGKKSELHKGVQNPSM